MSDQEATYSINLDGNAVEVSKEASDALEDMRKSANAAEEAIKRGSAALRGLRGSSDEVKEAKSKLKAAMDAERERLTASNLAILKQGSSLRELNERHKQASDAAKDSTKSHEGLNMGLLKLLGVSREARMKIGELSSGFSAAELATAGLVAGSLALVGALAGVAYGAVSAATALGRFVFVGTDANRSLQLSRQWIAGSAEDSARMGDQIDRIRQKVPMTTEELSKLYVKTREGFDGARLSGQGILDTVNAIAQASGAGAEAAASKIDQILERGKQFGRIGINGPNAWNPAGELGGTGLKFERVGQALADDLHISLAQAEGMLRSYRVPIEAGARALRKASEEAFGGINLDALTTADALTKKYHDDIANLTRGVDMGGFWRSLARIENTLSTSTTSGYALKTMVEAIGREFGIVGTKNAPILETAIRMVILEASKVELSFLRAENIWLRTGKETGIVKSLKTAWDIAKDIYDVIKDIADVASHVHLSAFNPTNLNNPADWLAEERARNEATTGAGLLTTRGKGQLTGGGPAVVTAPGHATGGTVVQPAPGEAFASVAPGERIVPRGGSVGGGRGGVTLNLTLSVNVMATSAAGKDVAQAIQKSSVIEDLTRAIQDALQGAGIPIMPDAS